MRGEMLARLLPKSLALRAIALSTLWAALSLAVIATVILQLYRDASEEGFRDLLTAHLNNLVGSVSIGLDGSISGAPDLGEDFSRPLTGWYWSVEPQGNGRAAVIRSNSMGGQSIPVADTQIFPFLPPLFTRTYQSTGVSEETLQIVESKAIVNDAGDALLYRVMGNRSEFEAGISDFARRLYLALALFGLGSIAVNALAILLGLNPLRKAQDSLRLIREGKAQRLDGEFPTEIAPLASEMNALIDNNRRIMERARTQVGNLAHSLKTPLAVIMNEGSAMGGAKGKTVSEQAGAMQGQIQHYLQRARIAAQRDSVVFRAPVTPILERLTRVMQKLNPEKVFEFSKPSTEVVFAGEGSDLEEIAGNLLENAAKWSRKRVTIKLYKVPRTSGAAVYSIEIGDDGPGLTKEQIEDGIKRGKRLDETKPGTGLGLSIVQDTVKEYGGALVLGKSALGGLSATITLPIAE
jgi:signal transduction histidine kinase